MNARIEPKVPDWGAVADLGDELVQEMKAAGTYSIPQRLLVAGAVALIRDPITPPNIRAQGLRDIGNFFGLYGAEAAGSQRRQFEKEQQAKGKLKTKMPAAEELTPIATADLLNKVASLPGVAQHAPEPRTAPEGGGSEGDRAGA